MLLAALCGNLREPELEDMTEEETEVGDAGDSDLWGLVPSVEELEDEELPLLPLPQ